MVESSDNHVLGNQSDNSEFSRGDINSNALAKEPEESKLNNYVYGFILRAAGCKFSCKERQYR